MCVCCAFVAVYDYICVYVSKSQKDKTWDFPGGPVVKPSPFNAAGAGSIPGRGAKILHASRPKNENRK